MNLDDDRPGYEVPSYRAPDDEPWYHFLHGNVPGHQIDFMYRPEVPQGALTRQHFSHLARLMKYIEPQTNAPYAFAIGNLSRDDTQHEPGHGGVALIFGLRIRGVTDHAGRQDPPFSHAVAAIDRELDAATLFAAARAFHRSVFGAAESAEWYRSFVRCATDAPAGVPDVLAGYVAGFSDMPSPAESSLSSRWLTGGAAQPKRIVIVHADDAPFDAIARCATRIAAMLYPSDVRWTAISNGREADVPNGVTIRFVAESAVTAADEALGTRRLEDVPEDEAEIAQVLFGATPVMKQKPAARGWRERYSEVAGEAPSGDSSVDIPIPRTTLEGAPPRKQRSERPRPMPAAAPAARDSGVVGRASDPAGDLDGPTVALDGAGSGIDVSFEELSGDHPSFDDAVTVGAPLRRVSAPAEAPTSRPNGAQGAAVRTPAKPVATAAALGADVDDTGDRRASLELLPAPVAQDADHTLDAGLVRRETVALSPDEVKRGLAAALPFKPVEAVAPLPRAAPTLEPDEIPNFRRTANLRWSWLIVILAVVGAVIAGLYVLFSDSTSSQPAPAESGTAVASSATPTAPATTAAAPATTAAALASAAPPATTAPVASAAHSAEPDRPVKKGRDGKPGSKPTGKVPTPKPSSVYDAPLY